MMYISHIKFAYLFQNWWVIKGNHASRIPAKCYTLVKYSNAKYHTFSDLVFPISIDDAGYLNIMANLQTSDKPLPWR